METAAYARRPIGYDGQQIDKGQIFKLTGQRNDEKLLRLGYVGVMPRNESGSECGRCGERFLSDIDRNNHVRGRHGAAIEMADAERVIDQVHRAANRLVKGRKGKDGARFGEGEAIEIVLSENPDLARAYRQASESVRKQEQAQERDERMLQETAPLNLDKTAGARA